MPESVDPKGLVYEGRAGTGAAFILPNSWKEPLAQGDRYAREDNVAAARAAALRAKQEADQKKANDKSLADLLNIDTSKAWDIDQPAIRDKYNALVQYSAQQQAAGKPVSDARNTEQWATSQKMRKDIQDAASASMQQQGQWAALGKLADADKDGVYDKQKLATDLAAYKAAPFEERVKMDVNPKLYLNRAALVNSTVAGLKHEISKGNVFNKSTGNTVTTTDEIIKPEQFKLATDAVLQKQGVREQLQQTYDALPPEQKQRSPNAQAWMEQTVEAELRGAATQKHERITTHQEPWHGFAPKSKSAADYANENAKIAATTAVNQAVQILSGDPKLFTKHSADHPGWFEANLGDKVPAGKFSYVTRDKQGNEVSHSADNFIEKSYHDPATNKNFILTTEALRNGTGPVEVNQSNGLRSLVLPLAGKGQEAAVNQILTQRRIYTPNGLDLSKVSGANIDAAVVQRRQQSAQQYQAQTKQASTDLQSLVAKGALEDKNSIGTTGNSPRPAIAQKVNDVLATGTLRYQGRDLEGARLEVGDAPGALYGYKSGPLRLRYKGDDGKGQIIKPADLPAILKGFRVTPPENDDAAGPAITPKARAANVSTIQTNKSKSKKSTAASSNTGGAY